MVPRSAERKRAPASCPPGNKCREDTRRLRCPQESLTASSVPPLIALATTRARGTKGADDGWIALLLAFATPAFPVAVGGHASAGFDPDGLGVASAPRRGCRHRPLDVRRIRAAAGRTITIVVPFTPGTGPDILARVLGEEMQQRLGQPVIVENKPGASGNIGTQVVARSAPDGNTLLLTTSPFTQNVSLFKSVPYDPVADFAPIVHLVDAFMALAVHPSVPATSAQGFRRLPQGAPRRAQLRFARARHAAPPLHGAVQAGHGHRPEARALSRVGARRAGSGRRPRQRDVHSRARRPAAGEGQPDPLAWAWPTSSA